MPNINIDELMEQVRIEAYGDSYNNKLINKYSKNKLGLNDNLQRRIDELNVYWDISKEKRITSHRKFLGSTIIFFKRLIRKSLRWYMEDFNQKQLKYNISVTNSFNELIKIINEHQIIEKEKNDYINSLEQRIDHLEEIVHQLNESNNQSSVLESNGKFNYLEFENHFRGTVEDIRNRQKVYIEYFIGKNNVLDIGCGRGEFLELLLENGIDAQGIEINENMYLFSKDKKLPVQLVDALSYLQKCEANSLGGIFMGQVIEHIPFNNLLEILEVAYEKLQPEAYIILETPNPQTLAIFNNYFYVDPSHLNPIHPFTIKFVLNSLGFKDTDIIFSSSLNIKVPKLDVSDEYINNIEEFNRSIDDINNALFGYQDYAILAKK